MFYAGLDLGQKVDHSALAVIERERKPREWPGPETFLLRVRHLERIPLGTAYTRVVERVIEVMRHPELRVGTRLVVDATGVGTPVVDELRLARLPCGVTAVTITGGEQASGSGENWNVPKKDLLAGLQILIEQGELKVCRSLKESATLVRELTDIRMWRGSGGRTGHGSGVHDDLAMAVALACWRSRRRDNGFGTRRLL